MIAPIHLRQRAAGLHLWVRPVSLHQTKHHARVVDRL